MAAPLLHPHQQCMRLVISPLPCQHVFLVFLIISILTGVRWYLFVVLIFISLMISGVEHLIRCLFAICMSSLEKCLFRFSAHFINLIFFAIELCAYKKYILDINVLLEMIYKCILLFRRLPLFCWWFPLLCRTVQDDAVPFVYFCFCGSSLCLCS